MSKIDELVAGFPEDAREPARIAYHAATTYLDKSEAAALATAGAVPVRMGYQMNKDGQTWTLRLKAPTTRSVLGVDILAVGTWNQTEFTEEDIDRAFDNLVMGLAGTVPVKQGHSSDEFNREVAEALGVPVPVLMGDEEGNGQLGLGTVANPRVVNSTLLVDLLDVPDPIATMIEMRGSGLTTISPEIVLDAEDQNGNPLGPIITAVSLLGAENPAIKSQRGLGAAVVLAKLKELRDELVQRIGGRTGKFHTPQERLQELRWMLNLGDTADRQAVESRLEELLTEVRTLGDTTNFQEEQDMPEILAALGLPEDATMEQVLSAIAALQEQANAGQSTEGMTQDGEGADQRIAALEGALATEKLARRMDNFKVKVSQLRVSGKSHEDLLKELQEFETKYGSEAADKLLAAFTATSEAEGRSEAFSTRSTPKQGTAVVVTSLHDAVTLHLKENPSMSYAQAYDVVARERPDLVAADSGHAP